MIRPLAFAAGLGIAMMARTPLTARTDLTLPNGLRVLLEEDHAKPVVAAIVLVNGGSRTEGDDLKGLSHYYEHIIFRGGTASQAELETRRAFQSLGDYSGYTSDDYTAYSIEVPKEVLPEALDRFADALLRVQVTAEKVEKDRQSIVQELHMRVSDHPQGLAWETMLRAAFARHPYRYSPIGTEKVVSEAGLETFRTFYEERYVPNQMVLAAVGDFDTAEMIGAIRSRFGEARAGKASFEQGIPEPPQDAFREKLVTADAKLVYGVLGIKCPDASDPDVPALRVLDSVLAGGLSSRLEQALREKQPLVAALWSHFAPRRDPAVWTIGFEAEPANEGKAVRALFRELGRIARKGPSKDEMERARRSIRTGWAFGMESPLARATALARHATISSVTLLDRFLDDVERVTAEDVRRVAGRVLRREGMTLVLVRPEGSRKTTYAPVAERVLPGGPVPGEAEAQGERPVAKGTLPGGATLVAKEDRTHPVFGLVAGLRGGARAEGTGEEGHVALLAEMLLKGTTRLDAEALAREMDRLGLRIGSGSDEESLTVTLAAPAETAREGIALLSEILRSPRLDPKELGKVQEQALAAIASVEDDSFALTEWRFRERVFSGTPFGRLVLGTPESVGRATPRSLESLHRRLVTPANLTFVAVGDLPEAVVRESLEDGLRGLPPGEPVRLLPVSPAPKPQGEDRLVVSKDVRQVTFNLGGTGPSVLDPDYTAFHVATTALGFRLFYRYVYEEGMAYRMWTRLERRTVTAPLYFEMGVAPERFDRAREGILAELRGFLQAPLPPEELQKAKDTILQRFFLGQQTALEIAGTLSAFELWGLGAEHAEKFPGLVKAVTAEEALAAARKHFDPANYVLAMVVPEKKAGEGATGP